MPQFHLRRFTNENNQLKIYDKKYKTTKCSGTKAVCFEKDLYTLSQGNLIIEKEYFHVFEEALKEITEKIIYGINSRELNLSEYDYERLLLCMIIQMVRHPNNIDFGVKYLKNLKLSDGVAKDETLKTLFAEPQLLKKVTNKMFGNEKILVSFGISKKNFITSDVPVFGVNVNGYKFIYYPITPNIIIICVSTDNSDHRKDGQIYSVNDGFVDRMNSVVREKADRYIIEKI